MIRRESDFGKGSCVPAPATPIPDTAREKPQRGTVIGHHCRLLWSTTCAAR